MRWVLLALCGCNQIFGVRGELGRTDAKQFDAPTDAQPYCPAFGVVPTFSPILHEIIDQDCGNYTASATAGFALATCRLATGALAIVEGPIDQPLTMMTTGFDPGDPERYPGAVRMSPDGDAAYLDIFDLAMTTTTIESYSRSGTATWTRGVDVGPPSVIGSASTPSRGPNPHILLFDRQTPTVVEYIQTTSNWDPVQSFSLTAIPNAIWLDPEGRRAIALTTDNRALYIDRADVMQPFSAAIAIARLPQVNQLFVNEDCTRAYVSGLGAVFYAPQI